MVAGKQRVFLGKHESEMVHGVAWRCEGRQRPALAAHGLSVREFPVRAMLFVGARIEKRHLALAERSRRAMNTAADDRRSGPCLKQTRSRRMIAVRMRDENPLDARTVERGDEPRDVIVILRTGIDHGDTAPVAYDITAGSAGRERAAIGADQPAHQRGSAGATLRIPEDSRRSPAHRLRVRDRRSCRWSAIGPHGARLGQMIAPAKRRT